MESNLSVLHHLCKEQKPSNNESIDESFPKRKKGSKEVNTPLQQPFANLQPLEEEPLIMPSE